MALGGSSLDLAINAVGGNISKTVNDLEKLNTQLTKAEAGEERIASKMSSQKKIVADLSNEIKLLNIQRQQMLTQARLADNPASREASKREAAEIRNLSFARQQDLITGKQHLELSQRAYSEQTKNASGLSKQSSALQKDLNAQYGIKNKLEVQRTKEALQQVRLGDIHARSQARLAAQNEQWRQTHTLAGLAETSYDKFGVVATRVLDALVAFAIIDAVSRGIRFFASSLIESNQLLEVLQARLSALEPSSQKIAEVWNELSVVTITTPFKFQEIVDAAVLIKTYGVDINRNMMGLADWATAIDKDMKDVAVSFGKIVNFSPRTAMLLSTRGLSKQAFDIYFQRYGDRAIALNKLIDDSFGGTAVKVSQTFQGILSNLSDVWTLMSQKMGEPIFEGIKTNLQEIYNLLTALNSSMANVAFSELFFNQVQGLKDFAQAFKNMGAQLVALGLIDTSKTQTQSKALTQELAKTQNATERVRIYEKLNALAEQMFLPSGLYDQEIAKLKEGVELDKRKLMLLNAQVNALGDYDLMQEAGKAGLSDYLKSLAQVALTQKSINENQEYYRRAQSIFLQGLSQPENKEVAMAELKTLLSQATLSMGETSADLFRYRQTIAEIIKMWNEIAEKGQKETRDRQREMNDDIDKYLKKLIDLQKIMSDLQRDVAKQIFSKAGMSNDYYVSEYGRLERRSQELEQLLMERQSGASQSAALFGVMNIKEMSKILDYRKDEIENLKEMKEVIDELEKTSVNWTDAWVRGMKSSREELVNWRQELADTSIETGKGFFKSSVNELMFGEQGKEYGSQIDELRQKLVQIQAEKQNLSDSTTKIYLVENEEANTLAKINELERERASIVLGFLDNAAHKLIDKFQDMAVSRIFDWMAPDAQMESTYKMYQQLSGALSTLNEKIPSLDSAQEMLGIESSINILKQEGSMSLIMGSMQDLALANERLVVEQQIAMIKGGGSILGIFGLGNSGGPSMGLPESVPFSDPLANRFPISNPYTGHRSNANIVQFNGNVYGAKDFDMHVDKAIQSLTRSRV